MIFRTLLALTVAAFGVYHLETYRAEILAQEQAPITSSMVASR